MTFLECCQTVKTKGLHMIRPKKNTPKQYDLCEPFEGGKGWIADVILEICWKAAG